MSRELIHLHREKYNPEYSELNKSAHQQQRNAKKKKKTDVSKSHNKNFSYEQLSQ